MINSRSFVAGRIYSVIYKNSVNLVAKRDLDDATIAALKASGITLTSHDSGKLLNPMADASVTVRRVSSVTAAGGETWANYKAKNGLESGESTRKSWYQESQENNCIVEGVSANTLGRKYLRALPQGISKEQYFIGDKEATPSETLIIRAFKEGKSSGHSDFVVLALDSLVNVTDETA